MSDQFDERQVETVARIIDPGAWRRHESLQAVLCGKGNYPQDPDDLAAYIRSAENRVDTVVQPSLEAARKILTALNLPAIIHAAKLEGAAWQKCAAMMRCAHDCWENDVEPVYNADDIKEAATIIAKEKP